MAQTIHSQLGMCLQTPLSDNVKQFEVDILVWQSPSLASWNLGGILPSTRAPTL